MENTSEGFNARIVLTFAVSIDKNCQEYSSVSIISTIKVLARRVAGFKEIKIVGCLHRYQCFVLLIVANVSTVKFWDFVIPAFPATCSVPRKRLVPIPQRQRNYCLLGRLWLGGLSKCDNAGPPGLPHMVCLCPARLSSKVNTPSFVTVTETPSTNLP